MCSELDLIIIFLYVIIVQLTKVINLTIKINSVVSPLYGKQALGQGLKRWHVSEKTVQGLGFLSCHVACYERATGEFAPREQASGEPLLS